MEEDAHTANLISVPCNHDDQGDDDTPVVELQRFALDSSGPYSPRDCQNIKENKNCLDYDEFRPSSVSADRNDGHVGRGAKSTSVAYALQFDFGSCPKSQQLVYSNLVADLGRDHWYPGYQQRKTIALVYNIEISTYPLYEDQTNYFTNHICLPSFLRCQGWTGTWDLRRVPRMMGYANPCVKHTH